MIGEKITKDIFDAQRELKKNVRETELDKPYFIWQRSETESGVNNIYIVNEIGRAHV